MADHGPVAAPTRILLIDEDPRAAMLIGEMLRAAWPDGLIIAHAPRLNDATREVVDHGTSCVLLAIRGEPADPLEVLGRLISAAPDAPVIVLSEQVDEELALAAVKAGAQDVLRAREINPVLLARSVRFAIERKRTEVDLAQQALHDPLTGLPNRALFVDRLSVALDRSRRTGAPVAVLFLDVDDFKEINDTLGHAAGDVLLSVLADRFAEMLRPMDTVARFGGDEFTFLFEELESEREAVLIADRIARAAAQPLNLGETEVTEAAVSIGIAIVTDPSVDPDSIIRDADSAMYRAKERGGDRFELYDEATRERAAERLALESALRRAIERSELRVHYQPQVSLHGSSDLSGFEALVRWQHPERGLIDAREFLSIAESTGLIVPIGQWVITEALAHIARWRMTRPGVTVSVNLSARQLRDPSLPAAVATAIHDSGASPATLCFEVTEEAVQDEPDLAGSMLRGLSDLGVGLAVDDFGTGHSSLASFRQLPVQSIKIDPSFVTGLGDDPEDTALLSALVDLGHALGLRVVAEGVETDTQLAHLRSVGCDGAQGFLFSRPLPEDAVTALLGRGPETSEGLAGVYRGSL
ncbi:MAG TPA: EAL domain-containing protein [Solirubrobacteraceae bacterium]|nr:EAL domain-containing protein [Solirubrobacteraceae bacterium]